MKYVEFARCFEIIQTSPREGDQFDWGLLWLNNAEVMLNTAYDPDGYASCFQWLKG